jgi:hypothetical protein
LKQAARRTRAFHRHRVTQSSAHRFLHQRADPCLFSGGQLLQREGGRLHGAFVEVLRSTFCPQHVLTEQFDATVKPLHEMELRRLAILRAPVTSTDASTGTWNLREQRSL